MKEPRLKITRKKYIGETSVISLRLPKDMLQEIDSVAEVTGRTRNELLLTFLEFALEHMEVTDDKN